MTRQILRKFLTATVINLFVAILAHGQDSSYPSYRPVPTTRPTMKRLIEDMKLRTPRIPLPANTPEQEAEFGERSNSYEALLRYHYLENAKGDAIRRTSQGQKTTGPVRGPEDPEATLSYPFKVQLFWIVSRTNNCQYCIGHQETKLLAAGIPEDTIAAMDCDWSMFTEQERAAFGFARKYTLRPDELRSADIEHLKQFYTDSQILEMCLSMGWNNAINRWKEGIGVPQSADEGGYSRLVRDYLRDKKPIPEDLKRLPIGSYLTETSNRFQTLPSIVASIAPNADQGSDLSRPRTVRPERESQDDVAKILVSLTKREPALQLLDAETTRERLQLSADAPVANWMRLLCRFPIEGVGRARKLLEVEHYNELSPQLRSQIAWIVARQDRAWYALATAERELTRDGLSQTQIASLDGDWKDFSNRDQTLFVLASNLATSPVTLTDEQVDHAVAAAGPRCVVQVIDYVTQLAAFDRITEAAQLPFEVAIDRHSAD